MQENKDRQIKEMRKSMTDMNENITKETELIKKNQIENLELNSSISEIKNTTEHFNSRIHQGEERISGIKDKNFEITQSNKNKEKRIKKNDESLCKIEIS